MNDFMTDNIDNLNLADLRNYVRALRGIIRVKDARFGTEVARNASALTHYSQTIAQAEALAKKGDGSALVAMFTERDADTEGVMYWHEGDDLVEATYGVNGKVAERINGGDAVNEPTMQREVAIAHIFPSGNGCSFYATQDAVTEFGKFGQVRHIRDDLYVIDIDTRYNVDEVIAFIRNYGVMQ